MLVSMEAEKPQTAHPNQVKPAGVVSSVGNYEDSLCSQEYIDDLDRLLKAATHPRSTALLQKALEEAEKEELANGAPKGSSGAKPRTTATARSAHKISQYGKTANHEHRYTRLTLSAKKLHHLSLCVGIHIIMHPCFVCVCTCLKGWDQTSKVVKIYITSISELSQASKDDVRAKFKDK